MPFDFKMADGTNGEENASDVAAVQEGRPTTTTTTTGGSCWKCSKPFWPTCLKLIKISGTSWLDPEIVFKLACEVLEKSVVYNKKIELK